MRPSLQAEVPIFHYRDEPGADPEARDVHVEYTRDRGPEVEAE
jgi:hypothetical protein